MLRVSLEIVPPDGPVREIGVLKLANVAALDGDGAQYTGSLQTRNSDGRTTLRLIDIPRHERAEGAWKLVQLALKTALGEP